MSDDTTPGSGEQDAGAVEHQTIVNRILEYQRRLREGDPPPPVETLPEGPMTERVAVETSSGEEADLVDLTEAEEKVAPVVRLEPPGSQRPATSGVWAIPEPARPQPVETTDRMAELEDALRRVFETITELRQRFQDMAVASDERLAELEQIVEGARRSTRV